MAQKILLVDDEPEIVKLLRAYLEQAGYDVATASDGKEALLVTRHEKPDLIVLDLTMPEMDGLEYTRRLRREKDTPIIMLTARVEEMDRIIGLELGPTITSPSPSARARSSPACGQSCAGSSRHPPRPRYCARATWSWTNKSTASP
jgi:CheY-like chemotaxis protein